MKRIIPMIVLLLLLVGCQGMFSNEYVYVTEHIAPFAVKETTQEALPQTEETLYTATNLKGVRDAIKDMVRNGEEKGKILLEFHEEDAKDLNVNNLLNALCNDSPLYVYAMHQDSFSCNLSKKSLDPVLSVSFKLRLAAREVASIEKTGTFWFKEEALDYIYKALNDQKSSCTMQVSNYDADIDLIALLDDYILHHPEEVSDAPEIQVTVFPVTGGSVRVLDFLFSYKDNPAYLSYHKIKTNQFFEMVVGEMPSKTESGTGSEDPAKEAVESLYRQLIPASRYDISEDATVYSLVVEKKKSNSRVMASVVEYLCCRAGWECEIVIGTREGERWYWNRLKEDGQWRYFDLQTAAGKRRSPPLCSAEEMRTLQYEWDSTQYPEMEPPPEDPEKPTDPGGTSEDSQTPVVPTELPQPSEGEPSSEPLLTETTRPESATETGDNPA